MRPPGTRQASNVPKILAFVNDDGIPSECWLNLNCVVERIRQRTLVKFPFTDPGRRRDTCLPGDPSAQCVEPGDGEVVNVSQLLFQVACQRTAVTGQECLPSGSRRPERFLDGYNRLASSCTTSNKRPWDIGDDVEDLVLGRFKGTKLRIGFRQRGANPEAQRKRMRQKSFQSSNPVMTQRLAVARALVSLQPLCNPVVQPITKLP